MGGVNERDVLPIENEVKRIASSIQRIDNLIDQSERPEWKAKETTADTSAPVNPSRPSNIRSIENERRKRKRQLMHQRLFGR